MSEFSDYLNSLSLNYQIIDQSNSHIIFSTTIWAKPGSKKERISISEGRLLVAISEKPIDGQANKGIIKYISKKFGIPQSAIELSSGERSKHKGFVIRFDFTNSKDVGYYLERLKKVINL